jgi:hypothetical protein
MTTVTDDLNLRRAPQSAIALLTPAKTRDAEEALNARLARAGRAPGSYTADELEEAYATVTTSIGSDVVRDVFLEHGYGAETTVSEQLLRNTADEILRSKGFYEVGGNGGLVLPTRDDETAAFRAAVEQLGLPGEERKDLATIAASRRDALIDGAIADGVFTAKLGEVYRKQYDVHPELTMKTVAALRADPRRVAFVGAEETPIDGEGWELHTRAENILLAKGKATRHPVTDDLVFAEGVDASDAYLRALKSASREMADTDVVTG